MVSARVASVIATALSNGLICSKHNDRIELVTIGGRHGDRDTFLVLRDLYRTVGEQGRADDLPLDRGQCDALVFPLEYMNVNGFLFVRTGPPWPRLERSAACGVNTFTILV